MINPLMCLTGQDRVAAVEEHFISLHNPNKRGTDYFLLGRQTVCYFIRKKILNRELTGCFPGRLSTTKKATSAVYMQTTTSCLDIGSLHLLTRIDYRLRTRTYLNMNKKCKTKNTITQNIDNLQLLTLDSDYQQTTNYDCFAGKSPLHTSASDPFCRQLLSAS